MNYVIKLLLAICLLCLTFVAQAQVACPPGLMPYGTAQNVSACGPIPGYDQNEQQPQARQTLWKSKWGAIATDANAGSLGIAINTGSRDEAETTALSDCRKNRGRNCKLQTWYSNGCAVMILGDNGFNVINAATVEKAVNDGMKICSADGDRGCHVYYSGCSPPERIQ